MIVLLKITPDWIVAIATVALAFLTGVLVAPIINKFYKERGISNKSKRLSMEEERRANVKPNFEILIPSSKIDYKMIKLRNVGSKAYGISLVAFGPGFPTTLNRDKEEVDKDASLNIFLGDDFNQIRIQNVTIGISYGDVDSRRYQQSYYITENGEEISPPELLIQPKNKV